VNLSVKSNIFDDNISITFTTHPETTYFNSKAKMIIVVQLFSKLSETNKLLLG